MALVGDSSIIVNFGDIRFQLYFIVSPFDPLKREEKNKVCVFPGRPGEGGEVPAAAGGGEHGRGDGRPRLPPPQVPRPQAPLPRPRILREGENIEKCVDNGYKCQPNFTKVVTSSG